MNEEIMGLKQLAAFLKCCETTVWRLAKRGTISGVRIGASWRFNKNAVLKALYDETRRQNQSGQLAPPAG